MNHVIELDFYYDYLAVENGKETIGWDGKTLQEHGFKLDAVVTEENGPGGSCVSFIGEKDEIVRFLNDVYAVGAEDMMEDFISYIEPYKA